LNCLWLLCASSYAEQNKRRISNKDRYPVYRWTFDLEDGPVFRNVVDNSQGTIVGYETHVNRVDGRTLTSDIVQAMKALYFDGTNGYANCGPTPNWNDEKHRTIAFYVKRAKGPQPNAVLLYQKGNKEPALKVSLGPKGDGTDLSVRLGKALWESELSEPIREEVWAHIIITYSHPGIEVFIDTYEQKKKGVRGSLDAGASDFCIGGASGQKGFKGAIDDVRLFNLAHRGTYFVMPRYKIRVPQPNRVRRSEPQWYRGKALALRITWNQYLYAQSWKKKDAGKFFNGDEIAQMAIDAGACGVLMKMRAPDGFPVFPSLLNPPTDRPTRDYAGELVAALQKKGLWFAPNLSKANIDAMAKIMNVSRKDSYYALVKEIFDRYKINFYQFRFDSFWGQDETYDPAEYNHQRVFELFRKEHPETLINFNRFSGHGAEDMADIETSRPTDQLHYWEQEDFPSLIQCRKWNWAVEVETPMGDQWGSGGEITSLPPKHLLNKISVLSAMGITTVLGFGPDVTGRFNDIHRRTLHEIGEWLVPRKPYLDDARPVHNIVVEGYPGLWYVNKVKTSIVVSLLSGSRKPISLPRFIIVKNVEKIEKIRLAPTLTPLSFYRIGENSIKISLENVEQDLFNTIVVID
jgi:hypothetical protein